MATDTTKAEHAARSVRLKPHHQEDVRRKIQASQIVNRLQDCLAGITELTSIQVTCAKILLDKSLASLTNTTIDGAITHEIQRIERLIVDAGDHVQAIEDNSQ